MQFRAVLPDSDYRSLAESLLAPISPPLPWRHKFALPEAKAFSFGGFLFVGVLAFAVAWPVQSLSAAY